jgi:hypothetical protein
MCRSFAIYRDMRIARNVHVILDVHQLSRASP